MAIGLREELLASPGVAAITDLLAVHCRQLIVRHRRRHRQCADVLPLFPCLKDACQRTLLGPYHQPFCLACHVPDLSIYTCYFHTLLVLHIYSGQRSLTHAGLRLIAELIHNADTHQHQIFDRASLVHVLVAVPHGQHHHLAVIFDGIDGHKAVPRIHRRQTEAELLHLVGVLVQRYCTLGPGVPNAAVAVAGRRAVVDLLCGVAERNRILDTFRIGKTGFDPMLLITGVHLHSQHAYTVYDLVIIVVIFAAFQLSGERDRKVPPQIRCGKAAGAPQHLRRTVFFAQWIGLDAVIPLGLGDLHH